MYGIYSELAGHAEMQMDMILDCEPVPALSDIAYYAEMGYECEKWTKAISELIALQCKYQAVAFANEKHYHVVTLTEYPSYTQVDLHETELDQDGGAFLKHKLTACAPTGDSDKHDTCLSLILHSYQAAYGKLIVL